MIEFENVISNYSQTKADNRLVPGKNITISLESLRQDIPELFKTYIVTAGYAIDDFQFKGSAGEPNRSFAKVPWVAIYKKSVTTSAQRGHYIVLLFSEDMSAVSLSLNQGYTAFKERYVQLELAYTKLRDCARAVADELAAKFPGFSTGPIDLHTDGKPAKGYEAGSILFKTYLADATPSHGAFEKDIHDLLKAYIDLSNRHPDSLIDLDVGVPASSFNEVAEKISLSAPKTPATAGPQPLPPMGKYKGSAKYVRSPQVVSRALAISESICALATDTQVHISFTSRTSKRNYVEAHHLVPFSQQASFPISLDVEENITALCPNCHRMLHHGIGTEKMKALKSLFRTRGAALQARGIDITFEQLKKMYGELSEDD